MGSVELGERVAVCDVVTHPCSPLLSGAKACATPVVCRSPTPLASVWRAAGMNPTAIFHIAAALSIGGALFVSGQTLTIGLVALGVVLFVAGIVVARRGDS